MSRSNLHKDKGKFNNGLLEEIPTKLLNFFTRHNNDWGEFRKAKKDLQNKIAEKEMNKEVETVLTDKKLIELYNLGWLDYMDGKLDISMALVKPYYIGANHAELGDFPEGFDSFTDEEILRMVK